MDLMLNGAEDCGQANGLGLLLRELFEVKLLPRGVPVMCADSVYLSRMPSPAAQYNWSYQEVSLM